MARKDDWGYYRDEDAPHRRVNILPYLLVALLAAGGLAYYQFVPDRFISGRLYDAYSQQPLANQFISVTTNLPITDTNPLPALRKQVTLTATTDLTGTYTLKNLPTDAVIHINAEGYNREAITVAEAVGLTAFDRAMKPFALRGSVLDASTGKPIPSAFIMIGKPDAMQAARSLSQTVNINGVGATIGGSDGGFFLPLGDLDITREVVIKAPGYRPITATLAATSTVSYKLQPFVARGLYVNADSAATPGKLAELIDIADKTGINTFVIDIKSDAGNILYDSRSPAVQAGGAVNAMFSLDTTIATLKQHNIYTIARISTFWDQAATKAHPDWAIQSLSRRTPWSDSGGTFWLNPNNRTAVEYNLAVAKEVVARGFDEVLFDYAWFPSFGDLKDADTGSTPAATLQNFFLEAQKAVGPLGGSVAVTTYGLTIAIPGDQGNGQELESLAAYADYICPTLFPSSYGNGFLGYDKPEQHPAEMIAYALKKGQPRLNLAHGRLRPWLQAFGSAEVPYGPNEIKAQTDTAASYNTSGWLLWNYGNSYDPAALGGPE